MVDHIEVNIVRLQIHKGLLQHFPAHLWAIVVVDPPVPIPSQTTFGNHKSPLPTPPRRQSLAKPLLTQTLAVEGGRIEKIDPPFHRKMNQSNRLRLAYGAKAVPSPLTAQSSPTHTDSRHLPPRFPKQPIFHKSPFPLCLRRYIREHYVLKRTQRELTLKLLVFAHLGEASAFIEDIQDLKACFHRHRGLYLSKPQNLALLITGEGMDRVFTHLGKVLAQMDGIEKVTNFGLAAALAPTPNQGQIVSVRTVYRALPERMEFQSYTSDDPKARLDCLSCFDRISDAQKARELSLFGQLLDRELWAIAALCDFYTLPFESFKLISDNAQKAPSCETVKSRAKEYSCRLYETFLHLKNTPPGPHPTALLPPTTLYWTESLRRQFRALQKQWQIKKPHTPLPTLGEEEQKIQPPKKKTTLFLNKIKEQLSPLDSALQKEIQSLIAPHESKNMRIDYDHRLESKTLKIKATVSCPEDVAKIKQTLDNLPLQNIHDKMEGRDVP